MKKERSSVEPVRQFDRLNRALVESEIDFGRTVHFTAEIDLTEIERVRDAAASVALRPTYTAFVAKAVAIALREFPYANRRLFRPLGLPFLSYFQSFHGTDVAVAIERNIEGQAAVAYIEVLRDVHGQTLEQLTERLRHFSTTDVTNSAQWRDFARLATSFPAPLASFIVRLPCHFPSMWQKYRGGSVLISSPAKYGVDGVVAAWTHPLGITFGLAQKKPMVKGDDVVATMKFRNMFGTLATGESADGCWTFKRLGFLSTRVTIRACDSADDLAVFKNNTWSGGGTLEIPDGRKYPANSNFWHTRYEIKTDGDSPLVTFHRAGILHLSSNVDIHDAARSLRELPWLVMLGWYLTVMQHQDSAAAAGS